MHQAIPYRTWIHANTRDSRDLPLSGGGGVRGAGADSASVAKLISENAVIVIGRRGCCMCHVIKRLLQGLGVNPPVYEVDEHQEAAVAAHLGAATVQFPAVFVGGKLFGGLERVMASHISGELVPILKDAGALWL
ncbi:Glutaredoxin-C9 [Stylosanthes scabra]|uniref:Glutaredoxin-C9 n=1 Tax=Stylosanthes scabra TaxID=79078 RepID=A0ABU6TAH0_9FABA|nr:Glutaredoxin-C9 [Stylosanthes scabra]